MNWLGRFFHRSKQDAQLDSELRFHVEQQTADNIAAGMNPDEARRRALAQFAGVTTSSISRITRKLNIVIGFDRTFPR